MTKDQILIDHKNMVTNLAKPGAAILATITAHQLAVMHMAVGIMGEVTELLETFTDSKDNAPEELGDIEFYFEGLAQCINMDIKHDFNNGMHPLPHKLDDLMNEMLICAGGILDKAKRYCFYNKPLEIIELTGFMCEFRTLLTIIYPHPACKVDVIGAKAHNIGKLLKGENARYKSGSYSDAQANARADKKGE